MKLRNGYKNIKKSVTRAAFTRFHNTINNALLQSDVKIQNYFDLLASYELLRGKYSELSAILKKKYYKGQVK